jgi:type II secretion system (T2SS) protein M
MTGRDRRALVLGGAFVIGAVLLLRVLPWGVRTALATEAGLRQRAALLARARADLAEASVLRDSAVQLGQALVGLAPKILSGSSVAEAVADLSGRVNLAASRSQAKLERVDPLTDSTVAGRLHRVALRAAFECDIRGLVGMLQALTFGKTTLAVRELRVTAADAGSTDKNPEILRVEMTVAGWFLESRETGSGKRETGEP